MTEATDAKAERLVSLDAFRGFVMLAMVSDGFGFPEMAESMPVSATWSFLGRQFSHMPWLGCSFWDLIQPSFLFIVGVAMAQSDAKRRTLGESWRRRLGHALFRSVALLALGLYLTALEFKMTFMACLAVLIALTYLAGRTSDATLRRRVHFVSRVMVVVGVLLFLAYPFVRPFRFTLAYVLPQIALGYPLLFLTAGLGQGARASVAFSILALYWLAFVLHPTPAQGFDFAVVGVSGDSGVFSRFFAHWNMNTNLAADFDRWFLNLFPRTDVFEFNSGGYTTLNFLPSIATMIFGLMTGDYLRSGAPRARMVLRLAAVGGVGLLVGMVLGHTTCPIVKRLWTPSWTIFSAGWVLLMLAAFMAVLEVRGYRRWAWPLVVVGMNSILIYSLYWTSSYWVKKSWRITLGDELFLGTHGAVWESVVFVLTLWLISAALYRLRVFLKI